MSQRNTTATAPNSQLALVAGVVGVIQRDARQIAILVLVLVLLITNGGAG